MTRKECLEQAMECVLQDRNSQYGEPEDSFGMIAGMWTAYLGVAVDKVDVAMMMGMLKMARIRGNKHYGDGYIDLAGYAACAAECSGIGTEIPPWAKLVEKEAEEVEKAFGKPEFKPGDRVEVRAMTSRELWEPATVVEVVDGACRVEFVDGYRQLRPLSYVRPVPKAEGCEELVQRIKDVNPAIYGEKKEQD